MLVRTATCYDTPLLDGSRTQPSPHLISPPSPTADSTFEITAPETYSAAEEKEKALSQAAGDGEDGDDKGDSAEMQDFLNSEEYKALQVGHRLRKSRKW